MLNKKMMKKNLYKIHSLLALTLILNFVGAPLVYAQSTAGSMGANMAARGAQAGGACVAATIAQIVAEGVASGAAAAATAVAENATIGVNSPNAGQSFFGANSAITQATAKIKECGDQVAQGMYRGILVDINQSMYNWARSGFKGSPAGNGLTFLRDPASYFQNIGNMAINSFIAQTNRNVNLFTAIVQRDIYNGLRVNINDQTQYTLATTILKDTCEKRQRAVSDLEESSRQEAERIFNEQTPPTEEDIQRTLNTDTQAFLYKIITPTKALAQTNYTNPYTGQTSGNSYAASLVRSQAAASSAVDPCLENADTPEKQREVTQRFLANFNDGGWNAWVDLTTNPANTARGQKTMSQNYLQAQIQAGNDRARQEEMQNGGFLSMKRCISYIEFPASGEAEYRKAGYTDEQIEAFKRDPSMCQQWETTTPGKVVSDSVNKSIQSGVDSIVTKTGNATFRDVLGAAISGLVAGLAQNITGNVAGLLGNAVGSLGNSMNGALMLQPVGTNTGIYTGVGGGGGTGVNNANQSAYQDFRSSLSSLLQYLGVVTKEKESLVAIKGLANKVLTTCGTTLSLAEKEESLRASRMNGSDGAWYGERVAVKTNACNLDISKIDFRDSAALARFQANTIFLEKSNLGSNDIITGSLSSSITTKTALLTKSISAAKTYKTSTSPNRETDFYFAYSELVSSKPSSYDIDNEKKNLGELYTREKTLEFILENLNAQNKALQDSINILSGASSTGETSGQQNDYTSPNKTILEAQNNIWNARTIVVSALSKPSQTNPSLNIIDAFVSDAGMLYLGSTSPYQIPN
jgi:hypothetical protein